MSSNPNNYFFSTQEQITKEAFRRVELIVHEADLDWEKYHGRCLWDSYSEKYKEQTVEERMQEIMRFRIAEMQKKPEDRRVFFSNEPDFKNGVPLKYFLNRSKK